MIHDKPFQFPEMLRRTIFLGRPNFFNAKDLNKELMTIHSFMEEFNKKFAVTSAIEILFNTFNEANSNMNGSPAITRSFYINWSGDDVLYNGVSYQVEAGGLQHTYQYLAPNETAEPREVRPPTYIVLTAELEELTFAESPELCGLTSDETPTAVSSVNVERYKNVTISASDNLSEPNIICILGTIHPRYKDDGSFDGIGFIKNTFNNEYITLENGLNRAKSTLNCNYTLFDYITEKLVSRYNNVLNERQLIRKFHLADVPNFTHARKNVGFSELVNRRQLVKAENLKDLADVRYARKHLGLGNVATKNIGNTINDVARGDVMPIGIIVMWFGSTSNLPQGWVVCDGTGDTPDMRGRFPVGYSTVESAKLSKYTMGQQGGEEKVTLTGAQSGSAPHSHTINDDGHAHNSHSYDMGGPAESRDGGGENKVQRPPRNNFSTSSATTGITINESQAVDATEGHENRPPFLALMFIMFVGYNLEPNPNDDANLPAQPDLTYPNFSEPDENSDGGYSKYDFDSIINSGHINLGAGVILTNPE